MIMDIQARFLFLPSTPEGTRRFRGREGPGVKWVRHAGSGCVKKNTPCLNGGGNAFKVAQEFVDRCRGENPFGGGPFAYPKRSSSGSKIVLDIRHIFDIEHTHNDMTSGHIVTAIHDSDVSRRSESVPLLKIFRSGGFDAPVKSRRKRHPGEGRGPELL